MKVLISRDDIQRRVKELGVDIREHYGDEPFIVLIILKGSFVFAADLVRAVDSDKLTVDFLRLSSYRGTESTGRVTMKDDDVDRFSGRNILIVEDIVDTGLTLSFLKDALKSIGASSVTICSLLEKPEINNGTVPVDFLGFGIPNEFVVGYGLDMDERFRNLPDICVYEE